MVDDGARSRAHDLTWRFCGKYWDIMILCVNARVYGWQA